MNISDKRAIRITELTEQLEEAKGIISRFVWPPDDTVDGCQRFQQRAARFAGCTVPQFKAAESESDSPNPRIGETANGSVRSRSNLERMDGAPNQEEGQC